MLLSGTVYGLSCLDGPTMYIGSTLKPIAQRMQMHWGSHVRGMSPVHIWMRQLDSKDHLTVRILAEVEPDQAKTVEVERIAEHSQWLLDEFRLLSLNVVYNPYRWRMDTLLKPIDGPFQFGERVSPYKFAAAKHLQPTGGAR